MKMLNVMFSYTQMNAAPSTIKQAIFAYRVQDALPPYASHSGGTLTWSNLPNDAGAAMLRDEIKSAMKDVGATVEEHSSSMQDIIIGGCQVTSTNLSRIQTRLITMQSNMVDEGAKLVG